MHEELLKAKRRKVRKGTQSCWECRRRKVRCLFTSTTNATCDHCRRRGTTCISQELSDEPMLPPASAGSKHVDARLGRMEQLIERMASKTDAQDNTVSTVVPDDSVPSIPPLQRPLATVDRHAKLARKLIAAWPSQRELDLIHGFPVGLSAYLHTGAYKSYSTSSVDIGPPVLRDMLRLPPPGSHPVMIARQLLVLGTFLQGVPPSVVESIQDRGFYHGDIMSRAIETAVRTVTTNDELNASVEGIECILMEALYYNYGGQLQRSWMAVRRATAVAQMMALHRGIDSPSVKILQPESRAGYNPDEMCFRLAEMDRYLSIMLGLPHSSIEARFASPKVLEGCDPVDRLQRIHCAVGGRILQRKHSGINTFTEINEIDRLLQAAAAEMPPQWWLVPSLGPHSNDNGTESFHEMMRLMTQFAHYHLVARLHLPYMLRSSSADGRPDHSIMTAVHASREILTRYVALHAFNPANYYCRGSDFLAFISVTVLCLAHIHSRNTQSQAITGLQLQSSTVSDTLAHSRPSDRGIMERTLTIIESMSKGGTDAIATKIARLLAHLLAVEKSAAQGTLYSVNSSENDNEGLGCDGKLFSSGKMLHVYIPYFGTINFERGSISRTAAVAEPVAHRVEALSAPGWEHDMANSDLDCTASSEVLENDGLMAMASPPQQLHLSSIDGMNGGTADYHEHTLPCSVPNPLPDFLPDDDGWHLQGVDVALFDSLFCDAAFSGHQDVGDENWAQWA